MSPDGNSLAFFVQARARPRAPAPERPGREDRDDDPDAGPRPAAQPGLLPGRKTDRVPRREGRRRRHLHLQLRRPRRSSTSPRTFLRLRADLSRPTASGSTTPASRAPRPRSSGSVRASKARANRSRTATRNDEDAAVSPDGKRLFFSSDRNGGIYNVYSVDLANGRDEHVHERRGRLLLAGDPDRPRRLRAAGVLGLLQAPVHALRHRREEAVPEARRAQPRALAGRARPRSLRSSPRSRSPSTPRRSSEAEPQALPRERPDPRGRRLRRPVPLQHDPDLRRQPRRPPAAGRPLDRVRLHERQPVLRRHRLTPAEGRRRLLQPQLLLRPQSRRHDRHAKQLPVHRRQHLRLLPLQSLLPAGRGARLQRPGFQRVSGLGRDRPRAPGSSVFRHPTATRRSARASSATRRNTSPSDRSPAGSSRSASPGRPTSAARSCPDRMASR